MKELLKKLKKGTKFNWCGKTWVKLGAEQGGILCITEKIIKKMPFSDNKDADYKKSNIKDYLENTFIEDINKNDLLDYTMDLTSDNGDITLGKYINKIGILSCDLYRKYYYQMPQYDAFWWTCTPFSYPFNINVIRYIHQSGDIYNDRTHYNGGIVAACILDPNVKISYDIQ